MTWLIAAVGFIVDFFASGAAKSLALIPFKLSVIGLTVIAISLYIAAYLSLATFFVFLFNEFHTVFTSFDQISSLVGSGSAYGVTLQSIWYAFLGFLNSSGISVAIMSSFGLFLTLYFSYFAVKISKIIANTFMTVSSHLNAALRMIGQ